MAALILMQADLLLEVVALDQMDTQGDPSQMNRQLYTWMGDEMIQA